MSFKPTLVLIAGRAVAFAATFFIPVVLVRVFDQSEFGTYKQVFLIYATLFPIMQVGMAESLFYFLPADPGRGGRYAANSLLVLLLAGLGCVGLLAAGAGPIAGWLGNVELKRYMLLTGIYLLLVLAGAVLEIVMISRGRYRRAALTYAGSDLLRALAFIVPGLLVGGLEWVLLGAIAFAALRLLCTLAYLGREFGGQFRPHAGTLWKQFGYALPFAAAVALEYIQINVHHYAVAYRFDAAVFAIYAVGCLQLPFVDFIANPASSVMMVRIGEKLNEGQGREVLPIWHDTTRRLALLFVPMFALLLITAREVIVLLFTGQYAASAPITMVWSAVVLLAVLQTDGLMRAYAQTRFLALLNLARLVLIVASIGWFMSEFHLLGAVMVTVLAAALAKAAAMARFRKLMRVGLRDLLPWRALGAICAAATGAAIPALLVKSYEGLAPAALLALIGVVYGVVYLALLLGLEVIEAGEEELLRRWLRRPAGAAFAAGPARIHGAPGQVRQAHE